MKRSFSRRVISPGILSIIALAALGACHKTAPLPPAAGNAGLMKSASLLIGTLSKNTATVVRIFPGTDGLVGVILKIPSGAMRVVWMTPHGAVLLPGPAITAAGQDLTRISQAAVDAVAKTLPAGSPPSITGDDLPGPGSLSGNGIPGPAKKSGAQGKKMSADDFLLMSRHLKSIAIGRGDREVWIYFDPNCIFCNRLWEEMKPYAGQVTAHWIPIGFLKNPDSPRMAAGILQAKDPAKALAENEDRFDTGSEEGGFPIPPQGTLAAAIKRSVMTNAVALNQAMGNTGELNTPTIVYRGTDGKPHSVMGMPQDLRAFLSGVKKQNGH